ncbi:transcriptional regulator [Candidatus Roizmanbacteria bacterium CG02_land_8_20_14_3_00_36_15]|uniref:Transcriptional regulator n=2 Tax=Candidatus Roizmaniibacteriota TaxID=1752723 RepID=A0A2M8KMN8_9BACT|nr:MAG: transcriptional regulator [Candidatus Roizmanbacteria bacterium CG03_land_8_20_14_0_80_36_21]PIV37626.1 MAG: transcriptional regulator [Candidatus Roizmanbacteria bacterium CG02_land_8_20_14_3_00_36_15]PIY70216.1 MAG: transcriptional regulator [Candidatus Roizmanbacteria bacterium CG_4_10_14_0_8_um_filter_36_36]PJA53070.1 MAG: transcriptional regulator [Candidatus Roizmanbacteria bacterium CG_4_9_14_3_um_filter_36_11]PJC81573.1 MAG: transcriptional regulator [Candidatus Roizmanbacteria 
MNNRSIYRRLGKEIIKLRKKNNLSQEQLALDCYIDRSYLADIEKGKANPSLKVLYKIARRLKIKLWQLMVTV